MAVVTQDLEVRRGGNQNLEQEAKLWPLGTEVGPCRKLNLSMQSGALEGMLLIAQPPTLNYSWAISLQPLPGTLRWERLQRSILFFFRLEFVGLLFRSRVFALGCT